jgi:hypothetical protein
VRGTRAKEIYDNTFNFTICCPSGLEQRSGTALYHDNIFIGNMPAGLNGPGIAGMSNYRETATNHPLSPPGFEFADGSNSWDANDTDGAGHHVDGQPPFLFDSGTSSSGTQSIGSATMTDTTKSWTTNQWAGFSVRNTTLLEGSFIISNTSNTITYFYSGTLVFTAGSPYQIHRVLRQMDQNGRGKSDQLTGEYPNTVNSTTGTPSWPHNALEPLYAWNNAYTPTNTSLGFRQSWAQGEPTSVINVDFFNLGIGFPADTTPSQVSSFYTAAVNGVAYTGTFTYPHPLVGGSPAAPANLRISGP